jgi:hypothetical protein
MEPQLLQALLGISPGQAPGQHTAAGRASAPWDARWHNILLGGGYICPGDEGMQRLWGLLCSGGSMGPAGLQIGVAAAEVLALMEALGLTAIPEGTSTTAARTVAGFARLLGRAAKQCGQAQAAGGSGARVGREAGEGSSCSTTGFVARVLASLARGDGAMQLAVLENVHVLPAISGMLTQPMLAATGLQLLQALAHSQPDAQDLAVGQPGLLQSLVGLLGTGEEGQVVLVLQLLRTLVLGNAATQLVLARLPGAAAALVALLGSQEGEVANEAAETLAALQGSCKGGEDGAGRVACPQ